MKVEARGFEPLIPELASHGREFPSWMTSKTSLDISGFVLTSVLTKPNFTGSSYEFTHENRRGRESNPRIDSPERIYPSYLGKIDMSELH